MNTARLDLCMQKCLISVEVAIGMCYIRLCGIVHCDLLILDIILINEGHLGMNNFGLAKEDGDVEILLY